MKNFKPSQFLAVSMIVGAFFGALAIGNANAVPSTQYNRSVRDMMARRHNASAKSWFGTSKKAQPAIHAVRSSSRPVAAGVTRTAYSAPKTMYEATASTTTALSSWFSPSDKDGSLFPGGPCTNCHKSGPLIDTGPCERCYDNGPLIDTGPCERCYDNGPLVDTGPCEKCAEPEPEPTCPVCEMPNYTISYNDYIVQAMSRNCCAMAPLYLEHVDFNLSEDETSIKNKMGNYRFRIFGCRRFDKEAVLNHGRVMEKNMHFNQIFEQVTGDCYNLIEKPNDICLQTTPSPLPEYILTAEITNFFMNVCDGYDWEGAKASDSRTGSSEMTVKWKLSNLSKTRVVWEGETTGYADLNMGQEQGEVALVEAAFADAVSNLQAMRGFENQLMIRLSPEELSAERQALIDEERALDPAKCKFAEPLQQVRQCELTRPEANIMECPAVVKVVQEPCLQAEPCPVIEENSGITADYSLLDNCIDENGGVIAGGDCQIVDDTWVDTGEQAFDSLCITTRAPYDVLTPENLYKVRASVVEISNNKGQKGAGLIVSDTFVLTSADLVDNQSNTYKIRTINGKELSGHAVRVNPSKNTALVMLETPTEYTPLPLNTDLPTVGQTGFMTLGLLDVEEFDNGSENYIDNSGKVLGYRYSDDKGSEIIVDTNVQDLVIGSVLIDSHGSVNGFAHTGKKTEAGKDLFLPTETALRSLGLTICDCQWEAPSPFQQTVYKPVTELIVKAAPVAPEVMKVQDRK